MFGGTELAFNGSFFAKKDVRVLKLPGDAHISANEVPTSSGCFTFPRTSLGFENRFILWRADGPNLYLDEFSTTHNLREASLCINFSHANVIPGVKLFAHCSMLVLIVPTQAVVYRLAVQLIGDDVHSGHTSVLSLLRLDNEMPENWDYRCISTGGITASSAEVSLTTQGTFFVLLTLTDSQLVLMTLPRKGSTDGVVEVPLKFRTFFGNIWKGAADGSAVVSVAAGAAGEDSLLFVVYRDAKINVWSALERKILCTYDILLALSGRYKEAFESLSVKLAVAEGDPVVTVLVQSVSGAAFVVLKWAHGKLNVVSHQKLPGKYVTDFLLASSCGTNDTYTLWAISREIFDATAYSSTFQPYLLWRSTLASGVASPWERVEPATQYESLDELKNLFPTRLNAIKHRIFSGESYSHDVVARALQVACKNAPALNVVYNDWNGLLTFAENYVTSGHFQSSYVSSEDQSALAILNVVNEDRARESADKFYDSVLRYCDEFQEAGLQPLGLWYSPALDLVGVIQQSRFTIYNRGDVRMQSIFGSIPGVSSLISSLRADLIGGGGGGEYVIVSDDVKFDKELIGEHLTTIIRRFAECAPIDEVKMEVAQSNYLSSSFSTGLLSVVFRRILLRRFFFAKLLNHLIERSQQPNDIKYASIKAAADIHGSTINNLWSNYHALWRTLSFRLTKRTSAQTPQQQYGGCHRVTICQAFFQHGKDLVRKIDLSAANDGDDTDSGSSSSSLSVIAPSASEFCSFVREVTEGALISLWPESTNLLLPHFLADKGYAEALSKFCSENDLYKAELANALNFYRGIANCLLSQPDRARSDFSLVANNFDSDDETLNIALTRWQKRGLFRVGDEPRVYSLFEFRFIVMEIFRDNGHASYALEAGEKLLNDVKQTQADPQFVGQLRTQLYRLYMAAELYNNAISAAVYNPLKTEQTQCLNEFIGVLLSRGRFRELANVSFDLLFDKAAGILEERCRSTLDFGVHRATRAIYLANSLNPEAARLYVHYALRLSAAAPSLQRMKEQAAAWASVLSIMRLHEKTQQMTFELVGEVPSPPPVEQESQRVLGLTALQHTPINQQTQAANQAYFNFTVYIRDPRRPTPGATVIDFARVQKEHLFAEARENLASQYLTFSEPPRKADEIISQLIRFKLYDMAYILLRFLEKDVHDLLGYVTYDAVVIDHEEEQTVAALDFAIDQQMDQFGKVLPDLKRERSAPSIAPPDWVTNNRCFAYDAAFPLMKMHWKILYGYLHFALQANPANIKPLRTVTTKLLTYSKPLPPWIIQLYKKHHFSDFLLCLIEFDRLGMAFNLLKDFLAEEFVKLTNEQEKATLDIPFANIDQLLARAEAKTDDPALQALSADTRVQVHHLLQTYHNVTKADELMI